jgi:cysteine sulfinate desulfinase/cysteine desulfurase-like protein
VRVSLGRETTRQDIDTLLAVVADKIQWLNKAAQAAGW